MPVFSERNSQQNRRLAVGKERAGEGRRPAYVEEIPPREEDEEEERRNVYMGKGTRYRNESVQLCEPGS